MNLMERERGAGAKPTVAIHSIVRAIFAKRLGDEAAADRFLAAPLGAIPAPSALPGLPAAADRLEIALAAGEKIAVFGHDDPDGITSAVVLTEALESLGAEVETYIPDRHVEGHGLYAGLIDGFVERGIELLVTTDGCTGNRDEVERAATFGLDVLVTDHHEIPAGRRPPDALVNPKADPDAAPILGDLTGAGVAALLARELVDRASRPDLFDRALDLVALGTIADWAPMGRSNRAMIVRGLEDVVEGRRPAIAALVDELEYDAGRILDPPDLRRFAAVFASVPSVDGRSLGFQALAGRPGWEACLEQLVARWRDDRRVVEETEARAESEARAAGMLEGAPTVIVLDDAPQRAIGQAATRLVALTGRPAAVLTRHGREVVAELRGPEGVHLVDVLGGMRELLRSWGGHRLAAGFSADSSGLEEIRTRLSDALARETPAPPDSRGPEATVAASGLDVSFVASLRAAAPFGKGNPAPTVRVRRPAGAESTDGEALAAALQDVPECAVPFAGEIPAGSAGRDPIVTFRPFGARGLRPKFEAWAEGDPQ